MLRLVNQLRVLQANLKNITTTVIKMFCLRISTLTYFLHLLHNIVLLFLHSDAKDIYLVQ